MKLLPFLFILVNLLSSCQSTILRMAGMRTPKIESQVSTYRFLHRIHIDTHDVYTMDSNLFIKSKTLSFKPGWKPGFRPVQIRCYDSSGNPVMQWASCEGFIEDLKIFDSVPPKQLNGIDTSLTLSEDLAQYYTLEGNPAQIIPERGFDYYFLVFFAQYFPKLTKESFFQLEQYMSKHPDLSMKLYKINVDVQEFWGKEVVVTVDTH